MVFQELNEAVEHRVANQPLPDQIFEFVQWVESRGRLSELEVGALTQNPTNSLLVAYSLRYGVIPATGPTGQPPQPEETAGAPYKTSPAGETEPEEDFFLSGLQHFPRLRQIFAIESRGWVWSLLFFALGALALVLARRANADCMSFTLEGRDRTGALVGTAQVPFGYLAEFNHGLYYLAAVPIFVFIAFRCLDKIRVAFRKMTSAGVLFAVKADGVSSGQPLRRVAEINRAVSRVAAVCALVSAAVICREESRTYQADLFGWVQAWRVQEIKGKVSSQLWASGKIPAAETVCERSQVRVPGCRAVVADVVGGSDGQTPEFLAFLVVAMGLQIVFVSFALFVAAKLVVIYATLYDGLRSRAKEDWLVNVATWVVTRVRQAYRWTERTLRRALRHAESSPGEALGGEPDLLRVELNFKDPSHRFGLLSLDVVDDLVLVLVGIGGIAILLSRFSNLPRGVDFMNEGAFGTGGQWLLWGFVAFVFIGVPIIPASLFLRFVDAQSDRREEVLLALIRVAKERTGNSTEKGYQSDLELLRLQTPWPRRDRWYTKLVLFAILVTFGLPIVLTIWPRTTAHATRVNRAICARWGSTPSPLGSVPHGPE